MKSQVDMQLHVACFGTLFMSAPRTRTDDDDPEQDRDGYLFNGEVEITVNEASQLSFRNMKVGLRTKSRLCMGPKRGWERDILFERDVVLGGKDFESRLLGPGQQRFSFVLLLPGSLADHDRHVFGEVSHELYCELEGENETALDRFRARMSRSRARSPSPGSKIKKTPTEGLSSSSSPSQAGKAPVDQLMGKHVVTKPVMVVHNPSPSGSCITLDAGISRTIEGVGHFAVRFWSKVFSIGGPCHVDFSIRAASSRLTVFYCVAEVIQTTKMLSPRDANSVDPEASALIHIKSFLIATLGTSTPKELVRPGAHQAALWRGIDAGGNDKGDYQIGSNGSMPNDIQGRPTTVDGVDTPIKNTHSIVFKVFFSVEGEDGYGNAIEGGGPGSLRVLSMPMSAVIPSCAVIPSLIDIPAYADVPAGDACAVCHQTPQNQICKTCPQSALPHPRHDHSVELVGDKNGICPRCSSGLIPSREYILHEDCACGMKYGEMEYRMEGAGLDLEPVLQGDEDSRGRSVQKSRRRN